MASRKRKAAKRKTPRSRARAKGRQAAALTPGEWFEKLVAVQKRLRDPDGCPWDREQTHQTLRSYLIEEAYEVLDALESGDDEKFAEEMGDLLLQVLFHSDIARSEGRFDISDVIRAIHDKMIRRHPHVFGNVRAKDSAQVLRNWERIKAEERREKEQSAGASTDEEAGGKHTSLLDGVSRGLPAMIEGLQLTRKAARAGFDWESVEGILEKLREEVAEVRHALAEKRAASAEEEIGDLLFVMVNLTRFLQVDPEIALKKANGKFQRRFVEMERSAAARDRTFVSLPREEKEALWESVKQREHRGGFADASASASESKANAKHPRQAILLTR